MSKFTKFLLAIVLAVVFAFATATPAMAAGIPLQLTKVGSYYEANDGSYLDCNRLLFAATGDLINDAPVVRATGVRVNAEGLLFESTSTDADDNPVWSAIMDGAENARLDLRTIEVRECPANPLAAALAECENPKLAPFVKPGNQVNPGMAEDAGFMAHYNARGRGVYFTNQATVNQRLNTLGAKEDLAPIIRYRGVAKLADGKLVQHHYQTWSVDGRARNLTIRVDFSTGLAFADDPRTGERFKGQVRMLKSAFTREVVLSGYLREDRPEPVIYKAPAPVELPELNFYLGNPAQPQIAGNEGQPSNPLADLLSGQKAAQAAAAKAIKLAQRLKTAENRAIRAKAEANKAKAQAAKAQAQAEAAEGKIDAVENAINNDRFWGVPKNALRNALQ